MRMMNLFQPDHQELRLTTSCDHRLRLASDFPSFVIIEYLINYCDFLERNRELFISDFSPKNKFYNFPFDKAFVL